MRFALALTLAVVLQAAGPRLPLGLELYRPVPADNPLTRAKISLGRSLFFDRSLSRDGSLSCAGCHDPKRAFTDGRIVAQGVGGALGNRNTPIVVNRVWGSSFFLDGRAMSLEQQAIQPLLNPAEMAMSPDSLMSVVKRKYRSEFRATFNAEPSLDLLARALASYVRTIVDGNSPFDRYASGDKSALRNAALRGMNIFQGKARCGQCHSGPNLTDDTFHNTGIAWRSGVLSDEGRGAVTHAATDMGAFKTPTLREISRTAPYMHDGSMGTLEAVIDYYDGGGHMNPVLDSALRPLHLTGDEKQDILAFLASLCGEIREGL